MKRKSTPKPPSGVPRLLLLTDCVRAGRQRRALAEAGISVLPLCQDPSDAFREALEANRPDLLLISLTHSLCPSAELRAQFESNPATLTLTHVSSNCWSSNPGAEPEMMTERVRVSDIGRVARFLQITRKETVPAVDFADLGAWLSMGPAGSTVGFMEHRIRPSGEAASGHPIRIPSPPGSTRPAPDRVGAICIISPVQGGILSALDRVTNEMVSAGIAIAFGTVVPYRTLPRKTMRLVVGILVPPVFPREPTQRKITHPSRQEQRTLEGVSP
jgi:hypothetical protein